MSIEPATASSSTRSVASLVELTEDQLGALCALTAAGWTAAEVASLLSTGPETVIDVRALLGWPDHPALTAAARQILDGELDLVAATRGMLWVTSSCTWCGGPGAPATGSDHLVTCTQCPGVFAITSLRTWCSRCGWWLDGGGDLSTALSHRLEHDRATVQALRMAPRGGGSGGAA